MVHIFSKKVDPTQLDLGFNVVSFEYIQPPEQGTQLPKQGMQPPDSTWYAPVRFSICAFQNKTGPARSIRGRVMCLEPGQLFFWCLLNLAFLVLLCSRITLCIQKLNTSGTKLAQMCSLHILWLKSSFNSTRPCRKLHFYLYKFNSWTRYSNTRLHTAPARLRLGLSETWQRPRFDSGSGDEGFVALILSPNLNPGFNLQKSLSNYSTTETSSHNSPSLTSHLPTWSHMVCTCRH
jgi:hypothetical protein